jgi:hypothetical protein
MAGFARSRGFDLPLSLAQPLAGGDRSFRLPCRPSALPAIGRVEAISSNGEDKRVRRVTRDAFDNEEVHASVAPFSRTDSLSCLLPTRLLILPRPGPPRQLSRLGGFPASRTTPQPSQRPASRSAPSAAPR